MNTKVKKTSPAAGEWVVEEGLLGQTDHIERLTEDLPHPERHWVAIGVNDDEGYAESVAYAHPVNAQRIVHAVNMLPKLVDALRLMERRLDAAAINGNCIKYAAAVAGEAGVFMVDLERIRDVLDEVTNPPRAGTPGIPRLQCSRFTLGKSARRNMEADPFEPVADGWLLAEGWEVLGYCHPAPFMDWKGGEQCDRFYVGLMLQTPQGEDMWWHWSLARGEKALTDWRSHEWPVERKKTESDKARRTHLAGLKGLTVEERL